MCSVKLFYLFKLLNLFSEKDSVNNSLNHGLWVSGDGDGTVAAVTHVAGSIGLDGGGALVCAGGVASP